jgi:hypothetical protein
LARLRGRTRAVSTTCPFALVVDEIETLDHRLLDSDQTPD